MDPNPPVEPMDVCEENNPATCSGVPDDTAHAVPVCSGTVKTHRISRKRKIGQISNVNDNLRASSLLNIRLLSEQKVDSRSMSYMANDQVYDNGNN